jgi:hypothetical protein
MDWTLDGLVAYTERWHDTWEIVASIATLCAVMIALAIALVEGRARSKAQASELERLRVERDEARTERATAEQADRQRVLEAQARQVVIWAEVEHDGDALAIEVTAVNYSDTPIFSVTIYAPEREPRSKSDRLILVGHDAGTLMPRAEHVSRARVMRSVREEQHGAESSSAESRRFEVGHHDPLLFWVNVVFRDSRGNWWRRLADGGLQDAEPWSPEKAVHVDVRNPWTWGHGETD